MATKEQLKKLRQKYGLGEFKNKKRTNKRVATMAKKRKGFKKNSGMNGVSGILMNGAVMGGGALAYDAWVSPMIPVSDAQTKNLIGAGAGAVLAMQRNKFVKNAGYGVLGLSIYRLIAPYLVKQ